MSMQSKKAEWQKEQEDGSRDVLQEKDSGNSSNNQKGILNKKRRKIYEKKTDRRIRKSGNPNQKLC